MPSRHGSRSLRATDGRLDIALALAELDPELSGAPVDLEDRRGIARIEDLLRLAPTWMWEELLTPTIPLAPYYHFLELLRKEAA